MLSPSPHTAYALFMCPCAPHSLPPLHPPQGRARAGELQGGGALSLCVWNTPGVRQASADTHPAVWRTATRPRGGHGSTEGLVETRAGGPLGVFGGQGQEHRHHGSAGQGLPGAPRSREVYGRCFLIPSPFENPIVCLSRLHTVCRTPSPFCSERRRCFPPRACTASMGVPATWSTPAVDTLRSVSPCTPGPPATPSCTPSLPRRLGHRLG